jgi:hypothetical protein
MSDCAAATHHRQALPQGSVSDRVNVMAAVPQTAGCGVADALVSLILTRTSTKWPLGSNCILSRSTRNSSKTTSGPAIEHFEHVHPVGRIATRNRRRDAHDRLPTVAAWTITVTMNDTQGRIPPDSPVRRLARDAHRPR